MRLRNRAYTGKRTEKGAVAKRPEENEPTAEAKARFLL